MLIRHPVVVQTRSPTEDIGACTKVVLAILQKHERGILHGVTAGWIEDRGCGFTEYAIGNALRKLHTARKVGRTTDGGHVFWYLPADGEELPKLKKRDFGALCDTAGNQKH